MTDAERAEHAARLRGLLYLACPDAPGEAITATAAAISKDDEDTPREAVPPAALLSESVRGNKPAPRYLRGADLAGADLAGANLAHADLAHANLAGADLSHSDLTGANLIQVDLTGADLTGANLTAGYLPDTNLTRAELIGANLSGANLTGADLTHADLTNADLTDANLSRATLALALHMRLPVGATWSSRTSWPDNLAPFVTEQSDEVSPGVYRVRGGQARDRSGSVRV